MKLDAVDFYQLRIAHLDAELARLKARELVQQANERLTELRRIIQYRYPTFDPGLRYVADESAYTLVPMKE